MRIRCYINSIRITRTCIIKFRHMIFVTRGSLKFKNRIITTSISFTSRKPQLSGQNDRVHFSQNKWATVSESHRDFTNQYHYWIYKYLLLMHLELYMQTSKQALCKNSTKI